MRKWNRLPKLLLALAMVLALAGTALAAEDGGYADVAGHWAEAEISRVLEMGLMDGKTDAAFAPDENITRADLVTALYRLAGEPGAGTENPFADVPDTAPYRDAVLWASSKGIVNGKTPDTFVPQGDATRQEIAKILNLFAAVQAERERLVSSKDVLAAFPDAGDVAGWARDCINWAVASEFISGSNGRLVPTGTATRAEVAAILCRYLDDAGTGDASQDNPRNQDGIGENELLVVSFGTSYNRNRVDTIGAIENALEEAFPDYSVRRGFTADIIIEHVYRRDGEEIDSVTEALERAKANGVRNLLVQPTHLMNGYEYGDLCRELEKYLGSFDSIRIGAPLLTTDADYAAVAEAMVAATAAFDDGETAICFMGHGTEAASNGVYDRMQQVLTGGGHANYFVGTVEAHPDVYDVLAKVQAGAYKRVVLRPMMIVAGDHANNDMAGDEEDSWKSVFEAAGYEVLCEIRGLGELEGVQRLLADHARDARDLNDTGIEVEPNPESGETEALADGTYAIAVSCEQSMFKIDHCELIVENGRMTALLTLGSASFDKMFAGAAAQAASAREADLVQAVESGGMTTFALPVAALDEALDYAAHSVNRNQWYDRTLTFDSSTIVEK